MGEQFTTDGYTKIKEYRFSELFDLSAIQKLQDLFSAATGVASIIGSPNKDGPKIQRCLSGGLLDGGASIIVAGKHIANWLIGQVLDEDYEMNDLVQLKSY